MAWGGGGGAMVDQEVCGSLRLAGRGRVEDGSWVGGGRVVDRGGWPWEEEVMEIGGHLGL